MSQNLPDHSVNKTRAIQRSDSSIVLNPGLSPLEVPELLESIIGYLAGREIVSAARVCRTWSEPALDRIWRRVESLIPLFTLIGPMYLHPSDGWTFRDDIKSPDWSRYAVYAPRIREMIIKDDVPEEFVSVQAMRTMLAQLPSHLQLPLPTSIDLRTTASAPTTLVELPLISQSLRKLSLSQVLLVEGDASPSSVAYFQGLIQAASKLHDPSLEEFRVYCYTSGAAFIDAFDACLIKHGSHIARLVAYFPFDGRAWASIFSLPALQILDIGPLNVGTSTPRTWVDMIPMVETLVEKQQLLKELRLDLGFVYHENPSSWPYSRIIRALTGLRSLETLESRMNLPLELSESEVKEMGRSWPKMRILEISSLCTWTTAFSVLEGPCHTDLTLLPCFIQRLPRLEELRVSFVCNPPLKAPQQPLPASALHTLELRKSPNHVDSPQEMVAYLAAVLPRHTRLHFWYDSDDTRRFWDGVIHGLDSIWKATQQTELQASM